MLLYRKKRQKFFNRSNRINDNIPMRELSTLSTINANKSKYRQISIPSSTTADSALTTTTDEISSYITNTGKKMILISNITTIHETPETIESESTSPSYQTSEKSDMDLTLAKFRRQALKEHNSMRAMYNKPPLKLTESLNIYAQVKFKFFFFFNMFFFIIVLGKTMCTNK
jgi:uncharacterized protein YkwD